MKGVLKKGVKPETRVLMYMKSALNHLCFELSCNSIPDNQKFIFEYPSCKVILNGKTRFSKAWIEYYGELGAYVSVVNRTISRPAVTSDLKHHGYTEPKYDAIFKMGGAG